MSTALPNTEKDGAPVSASLMVDSCNAATSKPISAAATGKRLPKYLTQYKGSKVRHRPRATSTVASQSNGGSHPPDPSNRSQEGDADPPGSGGKRKIRKVAKACLYCKRSHMTCDDCRPCRRCISRKIGDLCCDDDSAPRGRPKGSTKVAAQVNEQPSTNSASSASHISQVGDGEMNTSPPITSPGSSLDRSTVNELFNLNNNAPIPYDINSLSRTRIPTESPPMPEIWDSAIDRCFNHLLESFGTYQSSPQDLHPPNVDPPPLPTHQETPIALPNPSIGTSNMIDALRQRPLATDEPLWEFLHNPGYQTNQSEPFPSFDLHLATSPDKGIPTWPIENRIDPSLSDHDCMPHDQAHVSKEKETESDVTAFNLTTPISNERASQPGPSIWTDNTPRRAEESDPGPLPWNYTYSYARIYRHMRKHWTEDSVKQVDSIINVLRPYFLSILHQRSDIEIVQQERQLQEIVTLYEKQTFEFSPAAILLWRRTGDIVGANEKMAVLLGIPQSKLGRRSPFCIYELLDEASGVQMFHDYGQICYLYMPPAVPKQGFSSTSHSTYTFDLTSCAQSHGFPDRSANAIIKCATSSMVYMDCYGVPVIMACCFVPMSV